MSSLLAPGDGASAIAVSGLQHCGLLGEAAIACRQACEIAGRCVAMCEPLALPGGAVLWLTRTSWCVRCSRLKTGCLHDDIAQQIGGRDAKRRQEARSRNGGECHFDVPAIGEEGQERARPPMSGDRL